MQGCADDSCSASRPRRKFSGNATRNAGNAPRRAWTGLTRGWGGLRRLLAAGMKLLNNAAKERRAMEAGIRDLVGAQKHRPENSSASPNSSAAAAPTAAAESAEFAYLTWWIRNRKPPADSFSQQIGNLCMSRHGFGVPGLRVLPKRMLFAFPSQNAAVSSKVTQQPVALHPTTMGSCFASAGIDRRESSRLCCRINSMASLRFVRHSSRVRP